MLKSADYIYDNIIIADEINTTKEYCKKAQVGVDLSLKSVYKILTSGIIYKDCSDVSVYDEIMPTQYSMVLNGTTRDMNGWLLPKGTYLLELNEGVNIPGDIACYIIQRSSLNRSGCTIVSSLWDNGYTSRDEEKVNTITVRLNVDTEAGIYIEKNARVAQIIAYSTEDTTLYNGQFQGGLAKSNLL